MIQQQHQMLTNMQHQHQEAANKLCAMQNSLQQQQNALKSREDELARLQKAVQERDEEIMRLNGVQQKLQKAKESEIASLKQVLQKEKEEKLAKLNAAHNKRIEAREEDFTQLRSQLMREKDKEIAKLSSVHQKQLKAKEEEVAAVRKELTRERDERGAKLASANKELKASLASRESELAAARKQLAAAMRAEDELKRQQASALKSAHKEETQTKDNLARLKGSIEQAHSEELRKLSQRHEQAIDAKDRENAVLTSQMKQVLQRYQQMQTALQREREKTKEVLLDTRNMAESSVQYTPEQDKEISKKAKFNVEELTVEEMHWLATRAYRGWLSHSYTETDEVCDALEAETRRLEKRALAKEQELVRARCKMLALKGRLSWVYQVGGFCVFASMATGCVGAWGALATGDIWSCIEIMALAWVVIITTALMLLFGDVAPPLPNEVERGEQQLRHGDAHLSQALEAHAQPCGRRGARAHEGDAVSTSATRNCATSTGD